MQMFGVRALRCAKFSPVLRPNMLASTMNKSFLMMSRTFAVPTVKDNVVYVTFTNRNGEEFVCHRSDMGVGFPLLSLSFELGYFQHFILHGS